MKSKKQMTEEDIKNKFITTAITNQQNEKCHQIDKQPQIEGLFFL